MAMLPTIDFCGKKVTRLVCGGNPLSGYSHQSPEVDWGMITYYTMPNLQKLLDACWKSGINTIQSRGDRHQMRMMLEHRLAGGRMQWIAQTASEFANIGSNVWEIAKYEPIAVYHHGTHTDNCWHRGEIDGVRDIVKAIKDNGLPAGLGSHIPDVIAYAEDKGWETDFYMGSFYNLARKFKAAPAADRNAYAKDRFPAGDPDVMAKVLRQIDKPCLGYKIMAAGRNNATPDDTRNAFERAFSLLGEKDGVVVGMFQKDRNQVEENVSIVREILSR